MNNAMGLLKGTPRLKEHKGRYNVIFYDRETKRSIWHSLGTSRKEQAQRRFMEIVRAYEENRFNPAKERYQFGKVTLRIALDRWLTNGKEHKHWSASTYRDYDDFANLVCGILPAGLMLMQITPQDCRKITNHPPARETKRGYHRRLGAFLNWCVRQKYLQESPLGEVKPLKAVNELPEYFSRDEIDRIVQAVEDAARASVRHRQQVALTRLARVIRFDVASGLRLEELRRLRWKDIDLSSNRLSALGKGNKIRPVPLFDDAGEVLEEIREEHVQEFGVPPHRNLQVFAGLPYGTTSNMFRDYLTKLGFGDEYSFHSLRKTFASWAVMGGVDIFLVSTWLGHTNVLITQKSYAHLAPAYVPTAAWSTFNRAVVNA